MEYHFVVDSLHKLWKPVHSFDIIDLDKGFLIVKLSNRDDYSQTFRGEGLGLLGNASSPFKNGNLTSNPLTLIILQQPSHYVFRNFQLNSSLNLG
ncbi:hypothetical protein SLA2020_475010 [Shorea laevis]